MYQQRLNDINHISTKATGYKSYIKRLNGINHIHVSTKATGHKSYINKDYMASIIYQQKLYGINQISTKTIWHQSYINKG